MKNLLNIEKYKEFGTTENILQFYQNIAEVIKNASDSPELAALRAKYKAEAWQHIGEAGKLTADYMINKLAEIENPPAAAHIA